MRGRVRPAILNLDLKEVPMSYETLIARAQDAFHEWEREGDLSDLARADRILGKILDVCPGEVDERATTIARAVLETLEGAR